MRLYELPGHELAGLLRAGKVSSEELVREVLARIEEVEGRIRAFVTVSGQEALRRARELDARRRNGEQLSPLAGIPVAVKDNICTRGIRTTCSSRILENFVPPYDATAVVRLLKAGAVVIGKTNLDEFAMGSSTENSAFFPTRNPWDPETVPGGSSGGSAAAVAAGEAVMALGSDTGGSVRQPASFCGVVGMKPTYGVVSRYGLIAFASSLDQIGPITRDVRDCALLLGAVAGHDPLDSTSAPRPAEDYVSRLEEACDLRGIRIGVPVEYYGEGVDAGVREAVHGAVEVMVGLGAEAEECSLPHTRYALPTYYLIAPAEASSNLARYDGVRYGYRAAGTADLATMYRRTRGEGFGREVKRRIMLGTYALSAGYYEAYYLRAQKVRTLIRREFSSAFRRYDLLAAPTSPTVAFRVGERTEDPLRMYRADICTIPVNLAGLPAVSVPCGFRHGLPVGLQLIGRPFSEGTLLTAAYLYEQAADWERPALPV